MLPHKVDGAGLGEEGGGGGNPPAPTTPPPPAPQGQTFSQEDLDRIAGQRATEAKRAATKALLDELGFTKIDDLKAAMTASKEAELAKMSEAERKLALATEAQAAAERDRVAIAEMRHSLSVERELAAAGAQGDLAKLARLADVEIGAEPTAIKAAIETMKAEYPMLFGFRGTPSPSEPMGGTPPSRPTNGQDPMARGASIAERYNTGQRSDLH